MNVLIITLIFTVVVAAAFPSDLKESKEEPASTLPPPPPDEKYHVIEGKKYFVNFDTTASQADAATFCSGLGMQLLDLFTPEKEAAVDKGIKEHGYMRSPYWISGLRSTDGVWKWTNLGQELNYTNWKSEPEQGMDGLTFDSFNYQWVGVHPSNLKNFVCQERDLPVEGEYMIIDSKLYYITVHNVPVNVSGASDFCARQNMQLPDFSTPEKEMKIVNAIWSHGYGSSSMNFSTSGVRGPLGRWVWTNLKKEMTYKNFDNEPVKGMDHVFFNLVNSTSFSWIGVTNMNTSDRILCQSKKSCYQKNNEMNLYKKRSEF